MAKKGILAIVVVIIIISIFALNFTSNETIKVYIDGENVTVDTHALNPNINVRSLNRDICDYTLHVMNDTNSNISTLKSGINSIAINHGLKNPKISVDSSIGENQIPIILIVDGTSMVPTLQDGQTVLLNKTKNIHIGDIAVANSDEYGPIIKRVGDIQGNKVYLESDNKNIKYEYKNGILYETKGITTWVDISEINGVVIGY